MNHETDIPTAELLPLAPREVRHRFTPLPHHVREEPRVSFVVDDPEADKWRRFITEQMGKGRAASDPGYEAHKTFQDAIGRPPLPYTDYLKATEEFERGGR